MARSKIGFHTGPGGKKDGLGDWERALNDAGQAFGLKASDEYGPLFEAVQVGRQHNVHNWLGFRFTHAAGRVSREIPDYDVAPWEDAPLLCQEVLGKLPPEFDKSVWLELINEPRDENSGTDTMFGGMDGCDYLGEWCLAAAKYLNERGYKFMGPSFNSGRPGREGQPIADAVRQYSRPGMLKYLRYCAENSDQAALSLHEYSWSTWQEGQTAADWYPGLWGRFEAAIAAADLHGIPRTFHIFVTEFGFAHREAPQWPEVAPFLDARDRMLARWPQVKYSAAWTLQEGWGDVDKHVNSWLNYSFTEEFDEGEQPARTHMLFGGTMPAAGPLTPLAFEPVARDAASTEPLSTTPDSGPLLPGRGCPRLQYTRTVHVIAADATDSQAEAVFRAAVAGKESVSFSYDDAGMGDLDIRRAILYGIADDRQQTFIDWYANHYPGVEMAFSPFPSDLMAAVTDPANHIRSDRLSPPDSAAGSRGKPRVEYKRIVHVVPATATEAQAMAIFRRAAINKDSVSFSYDDAGIGDLDARQAILYGIADNGQQELTAWFAEYYPGVRVMFDAFPLAIVLGIPISRPYVRTDRFDTPRAYKTHFKQRHEGIDFAPTAPGAKILAAADGVVAKVGERPPGEGYGKFIILSHENGRYSTWYGHADRIDVKEGEVVRRGDVLGLVGSTGNSTGPHVHFNLQFRGQGLSGYVVPDVVNPEPYFAEHQTAPSRADRLDTSKATEIKEAPGVEASAGVGTPVTADQWRAVIWAITSVFESGLPAGRPDAFQNLDAGIISYGKHQATLQSGNLARVLDAYFRRSNSPVSQALQQEYGQRIKQGGEALRHDARLKDLLLQAAVEDAMSLAQDEVFEQNFYRPVVERARQMGLRTALGLACLYDTRIQGGLDIVIPAVVQKLGVSAAGQSGPAGPVDEPAWIRAFLDEREAWLNRLAAKRQSENKTTDAQMLRTSTFRVRELRRLLDAGNLGLAGTFTVRGQRIDGLAQRSEKEVPGGLPAAPRVVKIKRVAAPAGLNMRSGPSTAHEVMRRLDEGTAVEVLEEGEWDRIRIGHETGYLFSHYLVLVEMGHIETEDPLI